MPETESPFSSSAVADRCTYCGAEEGEHNVGCRLDDGHERPITVDGKDGRIVEHPPLVEMNPTDDEILGSLARCYEVEARYRTIANRAKNDLSAAHKRTMAATVAASEHYARTRQLAMTFTVGGTTPEGSDAGGDTDDDGSEE